MGRHSFGPHYLNVSAEEACTRAAARVHESRLFQKRHMDNGISSRNTAETSVIPEQSSKEQGEASAPTKIAVVRKHLGSKDIEISR